MEQSRIDRIYGVVFGQAIGDALGLGTEFMNRAEVRYYYRDGLRDYAQIVHDKHRSKWGAGEWTDDTEQMLCIMDCILKHEKIDVQDIAGRFSKWWWESGRGAGQMVSSVLEDPGFLMDPHGTAKKVWEARGKYAPNGAVMRTSILGLWDFNDPAAQRANTEQVCKITHFDPRCVASCVAVCSIIGTMLRGTTDLRAVMQGAQAAASPIAPEVDAVFNTACDWSLEDLDLDATRDPLERGHIGDTFKALGAGLWAFMHAESFEDGLVKVINQGGDADTNGAVAGSLLGARFGYPEIPKRWVNRLIGNGALSKRTAELVTLLDRH